MLRAACRQHAKAVENTSMRQAGNSLRCNTHIVLQAETLLGTQA